MGVGSCHEPADTSRLLDASVCVPGLTANHTVWRNGPRPFGWFEYPVQTRSDDQDKEEQKYFEAHAHELVLKWEIP